jgi:hypothetical protein
VNREQGATGVGPASAPKTRLDPMRVTAVSLASNDEKDQHETGLPGWGERTRTCRCHFHDVYCSSWAKGLRSHNVR